MSLTPEKKRQLDKRRKAKMDRLKGAKLTPEAV